MSATPKSLRGALPRRFEDYVLNRVTSRAVGLTNVPAAAFTQVPGTVGDGYTDDAVSNPISIGFTFSFDGIDYKKFVASTNGWMALVDPSTGTFSTAEVLNSTSAVNSGIKSTFTSNAVVLAPWFDDLKNVASQPSQITGFSTEKVRRIQEGLEPPPPQLDQVNYAVRYSVDERSRVGRRLVVRWSSLSEFTTSGSNLKFEAVIYENGLIEFRYVPRGALTLVSTSAEDASIGIFMPGGANRFRDFSYGLGYRDVFRKEYRFGGAVNDSAYSDTGDSFTVPYSVNLKPALHWPGLNDEGCVLSFSPPRRHRQVLPRAEIRKIDSVITLPTVARTGDSRLGTDAVRFDDRRSLPFIAAGTSPTGVTTGSLINYPSGLARLQGDRSLESIERNDLFSDLELTASVVSSVIDSFIQVVPSTTIRPFSEDKRFENDPGSAADVFFASGSSVAALGDGLQQPLRSKTQVRLSLPINLSTTMFGVSSSIYYYNSRVGCWQVPQNSSYVIGTGSTTNDSGLSRGDIAYPGALSGTNMMIIEDARGFGPIGNVVSSGSHNFSVAGDQTDARIGATYSTQAALAAINQSYAKSVQVNPDYSAQLDETLTLPICQPFLIERAVIELPLAAGPGWFNDRTTSFQPIDHLSQSFDFAGPALTVALFNQIRIGSSDRRDLIMTGTITHAADNVASIVFSNAPGIDDIFTIRPVGMPAYGARPGAIVNPQNDRFTGSVAVRCEAQSTNGVIAAFTRYMLTSSVSPVQGMIELFNTPSFALFSSASTNYRQICRIGYIDCLGRGATGFDPSGRSIFGKEFAAPQNITGEGRVANPFYVSGAQGGMTLSNTASFLPAQFSQVLSTGSQFRAVAAIPLIDNVPSPYLVMPGDRLVLSLSKTRPFFWGSTTATPRTSGSITHDVTLLTGTINVTLYGSLIKEAREVHDTLNQPLSSDAIHEIVIGNEPIVDQFETAYRDQLISGTFDDYVTGSLVTKSLGTNNQLILVTGSRGRVLSRFEARAAGYPTTSVKSVNVQPWFERIGTPRVSFAVDESERYWDSLMPNVVDCFLADGTRIWTEMLPTFATFGHQARINNSQTGYMIFDMQLSEFAGEEELLQMFNGNWTWAYPFEPRYLGAGRQLSFLNLFASTLTYADPTAFVTPPKTLPGFFFGPCMFVGTGPDKFLFFSDTSTIANSLTGSATYDDTLKGLFGFGDLNCVNIVTGGVDNGDRIGTNHFAEWRSIDMITGSGSGNQIHNYYAMSPVIRGWKYGVHSGLPAYSQAYFRPTRYGQFRDMLEQRPNAKYYKSTQNSSNRGVAKSGIGSSVVNVKFVDADGKLTRPENTSSQNLSYEVTSSFPYFDGETRNRSPVNPNTLNNSIISISSNAFSQITL